jgi:hypothetical protein
MKAHSEGMHMLEPTMLSVPRLAAHWKQTIHQILEHAIGVRITAYFAFDGLVFDFNDPWLPHHRGQPLRDEFQRLGEEVDRNERMLEQNVQHYRQTGALRIPEEEIKEIRLRTEEAKAEHRKLAALLDERQIQRNNSEYRGYLRLMPQTLDEISRFGQARHPSLAYRSEGERFLKRQPNGGVVLDGPIVILEHGLSRLWKETLNADDVFVSAAEVRAIEALDHAKEGPVSEAQPVIKLTRKALVEKYQSRWSSVSADLDDAYRKTSVSRLKEAKLQRNLYDEQKAITWAKEQGKFKDVSSGPVTSMRDAPVSAFNRTK